MAAVLSRAVGPAAATASMIASTSTCMRSISVVHGPAWLGKTGKSAAAALIKSV
jgi:hypothetical protein